MGQDTPGEICHASSKKCKVISIAVPASPRLNPRYGRTSATDCVCSMALMKRSYEQILTVAEAHKVIVNIEPHGYFTTNPEAMEEMLSFAESPYLRMNMDTGNTFIAGRDPVAFLKRFLFKVSHVHIKDVSESLAK